MKFTHSAYTMTRNIRIASDYFRTYAGQIMFQGNQLCMLWGFFICLVWINYKFPVKQFLNVFGKQIIK